MNNEFSPENRRSALWSGDSRKIANGRATEVYLEKIGEKPIENLDHIEAVQWGKRLQDTIGQYVGHKLGMELKEADYAMTHPKEPFIKSHFDFISANGKVLVEVKNYNASVRNKFGEDGTDLIPPADLAQCIHEATVHGVDQVVLGVLFGGQELCCFPVNVTPEQKDQLVRTLAEMWGHIQAKNPPLPESSEDARLIWKQDDGATMIANRQVEMMCHQLRDIKNQIKTLEEQEDKVQGLIQAYMQTASDLMTPAGEVLATWKTAKSTKRFSSTLFQQSMPDVYEKFIVDQIGSRRFLVK
jgi:predicted phage-related endonuclease